MSATTPTFHLLTEEQIVKAWQKIDIYIKLLQKAGCEHYTLREMPAAIHHFKLDTFKCKIHQDVFLKVNMMQGKGVAYSPYYYYTPAFERRVLNSVEKDGAFDSLRFRRQCRREFQRAVEGRQQQLNALGIFGDSESTGKHLDARCEAKIITTFNKLRELGYLNKVQKSGYWCQKCHSTLIEDEIEFRLSPAYSGYVKFPVSIGLEEFGEEVYFAVWVPELWQLAGSVALGLKPKGQYFITECGSEVLLLSEEDLTTRLPVELQKNINILRVVEVDILADCVCAHPFLGIDVSVVSVPELSADEWLMREDEAGCVLSSSAPTAVRHLAPGHHPNDYQIAQALCLPIPSVVDDAACLTEEAERFCGLAVSEAGKFIAFELEKRGYLIRAAQENIPQPHCWTCGTSALFRPVQQWVFSLDRNRLRHRVLHSNDYWVNHCQEESQRIQQTIREFSDLCVSCRRGWGIPIPVFYCEMCDYQLSDTRIIKTLRDVICRRGSDAWFKLSAA
ncbi:class I tRNA ligase family protein, partial [Candidatus Poribacteria bacterium]|nr:class I tRNA ligase family protein [Candidatus Poribacteria bacterium]